MAQVRQRANLDVTVSFVDPVEGWLLYVSTDDVRHTGKTYQHAPQTQARHTVLGSLSKPVKSSELQIAGSAQ
ncbi:hypothetical protein OPV22_005748 [Ensete ventricosum]|uniref:Uncharacterized protein n=1 Tax=Ensete ventricosum TaxID=4639 RepID=A0AAV8QA02_ENSVE|nr:hypothetical protein OPV22_005748 [Ensete ventricosum]